MDYFTELKLLRTVPESPGDPISTVLLTKTDEGLDLLAKGMEVSKDATDGFKDATGKIGKVKKRTWNGRGSSQNL